MNGGRPKCALLKHCFALFKCLAKWHYMTAMYKPKWHWPAVLGPYLPDMEVWGAWDHHQQAYHAEALACKEAVGQ